LARIRKPVPLAPLRQAIAALPNTEFGQFTVSHFDLYLSEPGPAGSIYTSLERFPLEHE
jgi:2'-5' RNA ligase